MDQGRGLLTLDYNNDGNLDVFVVNNGGHPNLYRNNGTGNDWLRIVTEGTESNRDGIGARITVVRQSDDPETVMVREVDGGSNYLGHNGLAAHFGLGSSMTISVNSHLGLRVEILVELQRHG